MSFLETPRFPLDVAYESEGGPEYLTEIVRLPSAAEYRNAKRSQPAYRFDAASGVQTEQDLYALLKFFHIVGGSAIGWRLKNWGDFKSCAPYETPTALDQVIATATAGQTIFQVTKTYDYGSSTRSVIIQKLVEYTTLVAVNGVAVEAGWTADPATAKITFAEGLSAGDVVTAGYEFDLPCRFLNDYLPRKFSNYLIGEVEVPIISYRPRP